MDIVQTAPSVRYRIKLTSGEMKEIHSPSDLPEGNFIE